MKFRLFVFLVLFVFLGLLVFGESSLINEEEEEEEETSRIPASRVG